VLFLTGMEPPFTIRTHHDNDRILYPAAEISYPALPGSIEHQDRAGDGPSLHRAERPVGAGEGTRTLDPLLGKQMCAVLSLMEAPDALIGSSWPSASRGRGPLLPDDSQATV